MRGKEYRLLWKLIKLVSRVNRNKLKVNKECSFRLSELKKMLKAKKDQFKVKELNFLVKK
jgi:hypothetical protein